MICKTRVRLQINPLINISRMKTSWTSVNVVNIRMVDPANDIDQEMSDNWPVWPCLKLVMIWGTRAEILNTALMMGIIPCI